MLISAIIEFNQKWGLQSFVKSFDVNIKIIKKKLCNAKMKLFTGR